MSAQIEGICQALRHGIHLGPARGPPTITAPDNICAPSMKLFRAQTISALNRAVVPGLLQSGPTRTGGQTRDKHGECNYRDLNVLCATATARSFPMPVS